MTQAWLIVAYIAVSIAVTFLVIPHGAPFAVVVMKCAVDVVLGAFLLYGPARRQPARDDEPDEDTGAE